MKEYNFSAIESKWQKYWDEHKTFEASNDFSKKKFYGLVEFPYPSGHDCKNRTKWNKTHPCSYAFRIPLLPPVSYPCARHCEKKQR